MENKKKSIRPKSKPDNVGLLIVGKYIISLLFGFSPPIFFSIINFTLCPLFINAFESSRRDVLK